ncbi:MAG: IS4/Tn5 family transposase DNA-binding protein [Microcystaceae cyanobacterium]
MSDEMNNWLMKCLADCDLGDRRLTERAMKMGECFSVKYGQPLSTIFDGASDLKRAYEFFANPKSTFFKLTQPQHQHTAREIAALPVVLSVGDTTPARLSLDLGQTRRVRPHRGGRQWINSPH